MADLTMGGLTPEPIEGNSLTKMLRSLSNMTGGAGKNALDSGFGTFKSGTNEFSAPQDFWKKILGGGSAEAEALNPEASSIVSQYDAGRKAMSEFSARGGGKNSVLAELPTKQTAEITKMFQSLRPEAAKQLSAIAQALASLGLSQEQIGTALTGQTVQNLLGVRNGDINETGQNKQMATSMFGDYLKALV